LAPRIGRRISSRFAVVRFAADPRRRSLMPAAPPLDRRSASSLSLHERQPPQSSTISGGGRPRPAPTRSLSMHHSPSPRAIHAAPSPSPTFRRAERSAANFHSLRYRHLTLPTASRRPRNRRTVRRRSAGRPALHSKPTQPDAGGGGVMCDRSKLTALRYSPCSSANASLPLSPVPAAGRPGGDGSRNIRPQNCPFGSSAKRSVPAGSGTPRASPATAPAVAARRGTRHPPKTGHPAGPGQVLRC
jgi:hypothetical protein